MLAVRLIRGHRQATDRSSGLFPARCRTGWQAQIAGGSGRMASPLSKPVFAGDQRRLGGRRPLRGPDRQGAEGAPRDALMADPAPPELRGAAWPASVARHDPAALSSGPAIAIALMAPDRREHPPSPFWGRHALPAFASTGPPLVFWVREPKRPAGLGRWGCRSPGPNSRGSAPPSGPSPPSPPPPRWRASAGPFSVLKAQAAGLPVLWIPLVLVLMNIVYALSACIRRRAVGSSAGRRAKDRARSFAVAADLLLAASGLGGDRRRNRVWGCTWASRRIFARYHGRRRCLAAELRATAFGIFNLASGSRAARAASLLAGALVGCRRPEATSPPVRFDRARAGGALPRYQRRPQGSRHDCLARTEDAAAIRADGTRPMSPTPSSPSRPRSPVLREMTDRIANDDELLAGWSRSGDGAISICLCQPASQPRRLSLVGRGDLCRAGRSSPGSRPQPLPAAVLDILEGPALPRRLRRDHLPNAASVGLQEAMASGRRLSRRRLQRPAPGFDVGWWQLDLGAARRAARAALCPRRASTCQMLGRLAAIHTAFKDGRVIELGWWPTGIVFVLAAEIFVYRGRFRPFDPASRVFTNHGAVRLFRHRSWRS